MGLVLYSWHGTCLNLGSPPLAPARLSIYDFVTVSKLLRGCRLAAQKVASLFGQNRITSHRMGDAYREASSVATEQGQKER